MQRWPRKFRESRVREESRMNVDLLDIKLHQKVSEIKGSSWSMNRSID